MTRAVRGRTTGAPPVPPAPPSPPASAPPPPPAATSRTATDLPAPSPSASTTLPATASRATAGTRPRTPDLLVVGGGLIGLAAAWRAASAGLTVTVLDPAPGDGASYAAAGMLAPAAESVPGEDAAALLHLAAADAWPAFAHALEAASGLGVGLRTTGTVLLAHDSGDRRTLHDDVARHVAAGLPSRETTLDEACALVPFLGPLVSAAAFVGSDHQADPRALHRALLAGLEATDRATVVQAPVVRLAAARGKVVGAVDDAGRTHRAGRTLLAAGVASGALAATLDPDDRRDHRVAPLPLRGVVGQTLRLEADPWLDLGPVLRGLVQGREVYVVGREPGPDGRREVVVGATTEETPDDRRPRAGGTFALLRDARVLVPALDECALVDATQRARPTTPDLLPLVGETGMPGLLVAAGHHRNGVLHAPLTADAVLAALAGGPLPDVLAPADPRRFAAAPRVRRRPAPLAAARLWERRTPPAAAHTAPTPDEAVPAAVPAGVPAGVPGDAAPSGVPSGVPAASGTTEPVPPRAAGRRPARSAEQPESAPASAVRR